MKDIKEIEQYLTDMTDRCVDPITIPKDTAEAILAVIKRAENLEKQCEKYRDTYEKMTIAPWA